MLAGAEHSAMVGDTPGVDCGREDDANATKEAISFLFKQIVGCISDIASQVPQLYEPPADVFEKDIADKDVALSQYKAIIKQLHETNKEIVNRQTKQVNALKEHFENLRACVDMREVSRQKLEFSSGKLKAEIVKIKQQISEYEQKTEIKALSHSEDVHALQQLVQRLVSGDTQNTNVLSMSQGGSVFLNPNAPIPNLRDSAPFITRDHLRDASGISANLHTLFDSKLRTSSGAKHSGARGRVGPTLDADVVVSGEHEPTAISGSLRDVHEMTRAHAGPPTLDKDVIVVDKTAPREVYEIPHDIREKREPRGALEVPRRNEGVRNGSYSNYETSGSFHIEDEGEESERKRQKTDAERQRAPPGKLQTPLRSTHPRSPHVSPQTQSPRAQSPLPLPNYHQFQLQPMAQRPTNNTIKKLGSSSGSPPPPQGAKPAAGKDGQPAQAGAPPANGQKKEPSEIWASEVLLAFSQGADSPADTTPPLAASGDLKRRLSCDDVPPPPTCNSLSVSGGITNGNSENSEDPHTAFRRVSDEFALRRSSGGFDEYSFARSSGGMSMGPLGSSGHKKRRGKLPESATSLLKRWLLEHQQHPYPTEEEKAGLATTTSLTLNQINNWFTNARRRILPKQKHGSPPSSPHHPHHGSHDDDHEHFDNHHPHPTTTTTNQSSNNNVHHTDTIRHNNAPTSPTHLNITHPPQHNGTHMTNNFNNTPNLQTPPTLLSHLAHTSTLSSTPLMAQLTAQLAQKLSANPTRPAPNLPPTTTILSLSSKQSGEIEPMPMEIKSSTEIDDTPTTAPHTISLATPQKPDPPQHRESPITISSELQKQPHFQSKFNSPLRISSPTPPPIKDPPSSSPPPTTATLIPTATLTTAPSLSPTHAHTLPTPPTTLPQASIPFPTLPTLSTLPALPARPPIFPSHPLFSTQTNSPLSALAQLGVSVISPQPPPLDPTPQPM